MTLRKFLNYFKFLRLAFSFIAGVFIGGAILFLFLTVGVIWVQNKYFQRIYPGIYLFSESVGGKTIDQIEEFLSAKERKINQKKIVFIWRNNGVSHVSGNATLRGEKRWEVIPQMIDFSLDKEKMMREVFSKGRNIGGVADLLEIYRLFIVPQIFEPKFNYNKDKLTAVVNQMSQEVDRPVQDALFEFKSGKVVNFQVSKEGRGVDQELVKKLITLAFSQGSLEKPLVALDLPVKTINPKVATSESNKLGIKDFLGEGESFFKDSISPRVHNIILASSYLHGIVIPPGETFSFSQQIGDISKETGYKQAYVIKEGKTILDDGGGVCQVSTTMFRVALSAGLPIVERQAHYYRVGFYEQGGYPPGLDATVYPPSPDFKFKNDTPGYILIQTKIDKAAKRLAFEFYGTADGRRVEMEKPKIESQTPPPDPMYIDDPNLPFGVIKKVDSSHWGAKVSFTRKVYSADNQLKEEKTFISDYTPWPAVYLRGMRP